MNDRITLSRRVAWAVLGFMVVVVFTAAAGVIQLAQAGEMPKPERVVIYRDMPTEPSSAPPAGLNGSPRDEPPIPRAGVGGCGVSGAGRTAYKAPSATVSRKIRAGVG